MSAHLSITVWSALDYSGAARRVIGAYKDGGRTDAAPVLGNALRAAVAAALDSAPGHPLDGRGVHLVTVPSSRAAMRLRGYSPVGLLLKQAGLRASPILAQAGKSADQAGLDREARQSNRRGSLAAVRRLDGVQCLVVDDIVTTGSTLFEAHRAITESGGDVVGFATLAQTRRRYGAPDPSQETRQQKL
jgi:predicted amidophosphoribosyltransferase